MYCLKSNMSWNNVIHLINLKKHPCNSFIKELFWVSVSFSYYTWSWEWCHTTFCVYLSVWITSHPSFIQQIFVQCLLIDTQINYTLFIIHLFIEYLLLLKYWAYTREQMRINYLCPHRTYILVSEANSKQNT